MAVREIRETIETAEHSARNEGAVFLELALDMIHAAPWNPRKIFSEEGLQELADSIREHGLLEPLVVRKRDVGGFELIAGERRWRAARLADLTTVPARILVDVDDRTALELALIENLQRQDLDPIEEAEGYRALCDVGMKQAEVAAAVKRSQPAIANAMRLLELPEPIRAKVQHGELTAAHGRALVKYARWPKLCTAIADLAVKDGYTTKRLEKGVGPYDGIDLAELTRKNLLLRIDGSYGERPGPSTEALERVGITVFAAGGVRVTPDVDAYRQQEKPLKREEGKVRGAAQRAIRDRLKAGEVVDVAEFDRDRFVELPADRPEGCGPDCACLAKGTWYGRSIDICLNTTRFRELKKAHEERQAESRHAQMERSVAAIDVELASIQCAIRDEVGQRALALLAARILSGMDPATLTAAFSAYTEDGAVVLSFSTWRFENAERATLDFLANMPASDLLQITTSLSLRREVREQFSYWGNEGTPRTDWLLGRDREGVSLNAAEAS